MPLVLDTLIVLGMATVSLGTIHEKDGIQERRFVLRNDGQRAVVLQQGYTSCGCTTIYFHQGHTLQPRDTAHVTLRFNPRGKGGEFHEVGTVVYGDKRKRVQLTMKGTCVTSEETLLRQFPIRISDELRLSSQRFDLGMMRVGESRQRHVTVLHRDENNRKESITLDFTVTADMPKGVQHIVRTFQTKVHGRTYTVSITFDVLVK